MRKYLKYLTYLVVFISISSVQAGSYEDFFTAVKQDNGTAVISFLRRGFDPNTRDPKGQPGLLIAVREPSPKVALMLIDWPKTDVEARNSADESALMLAALSGQVDLCKKLIARGGDVNKTGWTPLHYAATHGHLDVIRLLLEEHAYIDAESPNRTTPLMMAAQYGTAAAVKLLLEEGADPLAKNEQKLTAIDFATRANRADIAEAIAANARARKPRGKW